VGYAFKKGRTNYQTDTGDREQLHSLIDLVPGYQLIWVIVEQAICCCYSVAFSIVTTWPLVVFKLLLYLNFTR